jgi:hypothetical protein
MKTFFAALPLLALAACGGASGPESAGGIAPSTGGAPTPTPPPGSGGAGGGIGGGATPTPTPPPTTSQFLDVSTETSFNAIGSFQSLGITESGNPAVLGPLLYQGNASTVRAPSGTILYSPRDGIFTVTFNDGKAGVGTGALRFQDPAHRNTAAGWGIPDFIGFKDNFNIIYSRGPTNRGPNPESPEDAGRVDEISFFYQRPGIQTNFVTLAGYVRNAYEPTKNDPGLFKERTETVFERGATVFGAETVRSQIPVAGTASYTGGMLATMVVNTTANLRSPNYFQWINGNSRIDLDFSKSTMSVLLTGDVGSANFAGAVLPAATAVPGGSTFRAQAAGVINLAATAGFTGEFSSAVFTRPDGTTFVPDFTRVNPGSPIAGANSLDGTFFGPGAVNVGGNFRIIGGTPGERIDILGAFTGAKQ